MPATAAELADESSTGTGAGTGGGFIAPLLRLVLPASYFEPLGASRPPKAFRRLLPYHSKELGSLPGERVRVTEAIVHVQWEGAAAYDGTPTHCLTPRNALLAAREMILQGMRDHGELGEGGAGAQAEQGQQAVHAQASARPAVVFAARRGTSMRSLAGGDEAAVLAALRRACGASGAELVVFDGGRAGVPEAIRLFARARVVVGVHGGALSNVLFSPPNRTLLVELGLGSPLTRHFEHLAAAVGVAYRKVRLVPDERGVGAHNVSLPPAGVALVEAAVEAWLLGGGSGQKDEL